MESPRNPNRSPNERMFELLSGYWITRAIHVAVELDVADQLKNGPQSCEDLAAATGTDAPSLYRLLRALASVGIFAEIEEQCFDLTPLAATLLKGVPNSMYGNAMMQGHPLYWQSWGELATSIKTGDPVFENIFGADFFTYLSEHPEVGRRFNGGMAAITAQSNKAIVAAYDFSRADTIVDIGGGNGELLAAILQAAPNTRGVLLDQPDVIQEAKRKLKGSPQAEHCTFIDGNFFEAIPSGGDAYILKNILHDWSDEEAVAILQQCRAVMGEGQKLLIIETTIPPGNTPSFGKFIDLQMMLFFKGGRERTEAEFRALLDAADLSLARVIPTFAASSVIIEVVAN